MIQTLPSGRSVALEMAEGQEALTVRAVDGSVEVRIELTSAGPVVQLSAAKLQIAAAEVNVACDNFNVAAAKEIRLKAGGPIRLNGETVRLNCTDETTPLPLEAADHSGENKSMDSNTSVKRPFHNPLPPDVEADHEEVVRALMEKRPVDPAVVDRVRARAEQIRQRILTEHGIQDIGVKIIRELRGELPDA